MTNDHIGLGSNLNNRETMLTASIERLDDSCDVNVIKISTYYETKPVGGPPSQPDFLNAAIEIDTSLQPAKLLARLQEIENALGREREIKWGPRTIDMDILLCGSSIVNDVNLQIPHPLMHLRRFVLAPLSEIAPRIKHPIFDKTIAE
ncbi:MAG: 2-amino-4-hydroxy-6-hydroxymethyldihydropteridine diphosphokinase, partial [Candidatus Anammoxibacter sp.]